MADLLIYHMNPKLRNEIFHFTKKSKLTDKDKKLIRELHLGYQRDGLTSRDALEKAKKNCIVFYKIKSE